MSRLRTVPVAIAALALGSCSYTYEILAAAVGGRLTFIVDPGSPKQPSCLRHIDVTAESGAAGGNLSDTYWRESVRYEDDCANRFPLAYATTLKGEPQPDHDAVKARPLVKGVIYQVTATIGASGYGGGKFIIHEGGRIENLPHRSR